jgi:tRNA threonylcarbamoyladenosine biosynthesis protein TsaB
MLDARRMEVYMAAYAADLSVLYPPAAVVVDEAVPHTLPPGPRLYCGDGLAKCQHLLQRPGDLYFPQQLSSAAGMAQLAWQHWQARQFVPLHSYSPNYLKPVRLTQPAGGQQPTSPAEENKD